MGGALCTYKKEIIKISSNLIGIMDTLKYRCLFYVITLLLWSLIYKFIMKEGNFINDLELNKQLRKLSKIGKENYLTLQARENRKLNIRVKKYVKKVESNDEDGTL